MLLEISDWYGKAPEGQDATLAGVAAVTSVLVRGSMSASRRMAHTIEMDVIGERSINASGPGRGFIGPSFVR